MSTTMQECRKAAEVAERFPGWIVWCARKGTPVATRSESFKGLPKSKVWSQTLVADDWDDLETQLEAQP